MTAPIAGRTRYDFKTYQNENGGVAEIAQVEDDGEIVSYGGERVSVKAGDYVTTAGRPDQYAVIARDDFPNWSEVKEGEKPTEVVSDKPAREDYDPASENVSEVRDRLNVLRSNKDEDEFNRILEAEKNGKNRAGLTSETF